MGHPGAGPPRKRGPPYPIAAGRPCAPVGYRRECPVHWPDLSGGPTDIRVRRAMRYCCPSVGRTPGSWQGQMRRTVPAVLLLLLAASHSQAARPNIVYMMADDLGIGDVKCYGKDRCRTKTPAFDSLARDGMLFTDAHAVASVCVPSRIAIMTGRYAWRFAKPSRSGPWGFLNPQLPVGTFTIGSMLRDAGYRTGYVGKWHLGTLMQTKDGKNQGLDNVDYDRPLQIGPNDYGFDYSFILPGSLDMYPYVFARNGQFQGNVTARKGWSAFNRVGPAAEDSRTTWCWTPLPRRRRPSSSATPRTRGTGSHSSSMSPSRRPTRRRAQVPTSRGRATWDCTGTLWRRPTLRSGGSCEPWKAMDWPGARS